MLLPKRSQNSPRQLCGFALRKTARGDQGFQVRDLQVACRFNASHFTLHNFNPLNEILYSFSCKSVPWSNLDALVTSVSGQTLAPIHKLPLNEPLEKYNDPPAPPRKIETSPRMVSPHGVFTSFQANVDANGNNILGDAANEPSISVDPTNGNRMVIGWRQFDSIQSDFREAGWGYTTDAGIHWTFPGVLENNLFRSDPVSHCDETGKFFYLSLRSDQAQSFFCDDVWNSINGGQSWMQGGPGHGGDKEWFTIDKTNGTGHGFQYQFWTGFFACDTGEFTRSTDGGITWMTPINIPNSAQTGALDVDTNGNLFIGGSIGGGFSCLRSSNAQIGTQTPTFDRITTVNLGGSLVQGGINGIGLCGQTFVAVDRSGSASNNNVYMLASVEPSGRSTTDVMFARSTDSGVTFSAPHRINDDPNFQSKWHWLGTISVAPNARIDVVWYDTRNAANNIDSQLFYSWSTDGGLSWAPNVAVSNSFNPQAGFPNNQKIGDYITLVSDNTGANVAYAATFNVNPNAVGGHEQDVYYVRVSPSGGSTPTPTPTASPTPTATATATVTSTATATATPTATPHSYSHSYSHSYGDINSNSYCYSQTDADAKIWANAEAAPHAASAAVVVQAVAGIGDAGETLVV